jgi:NADPH:quinone reductase-like Zn-dependent oxidoreductase
MSDIDSGCDYSGTVEEIGEHSDTDIKKGDRIFGLVHGANLVRQLSCVIQTITQQAQSETEGAYAEHLLQKSGLCGKIPEGMSFEEASGLGVALTTIAIALYEILDAPLPDSPAHALYPILIYGGSTCQGGMAIQFAKLYVPLEIFFHPCAMRYSFVSILILENI